MQQNKRMNKSHFEVQLLGYSLEIQFRRDVLKDLTNDCSTDLAKLVVQDLGKEREAYKKRFCDVELLHECVYERFLERSIG